MRPGPGEEDEGERGTVLSLPSCRAQQHWLAEESLVLPCTAVAVMRKLERRDARKFTRNLVIGFIKIGRLVVLTRLMEGLPNAESDLQADGQVEHRDHLPDSLPLHGTQAGLRAVGRAGGGGGEQVGGAYYRTQCSYSVQRGKSGDVLAAKCPAGPSYCQFIVWCPPRCRSQHWQAVIKPFIGQVETLARS